MLYLKKIIMQKLKKKYEKHILALKTILPA